MLPALVDGRAQPAADRQRVVRQPAAGEGRELARRDQDVGCHDHHHGGPGDRRPAPPPGGQPALREEHQQGGQEDQRQRLQHPGDHPCRQRAGAAAVGVHVAQLADAGLQRDHQKQPADRIGRHPGAQHRSNCGAPEHRRGADHHPRRPAAAAQRQHASPGPAMRPRPRPPTPPTALACGASQRRLCQRRVPGALRPVHRSARASAARAACQPHMPCTPPPGGVDDEHTYSRGLGVV